MKNRSVMVHIAMFVVVGLVFSAGCAKGKTQQSQQAKDFMQQLQGADPIVKIKSILDIKKSGDRQLLKELVPGLISALSDKTSIQIPENLAGAQIKINTQFANGSELRFKEGDIFPTGDGSIVVAGANACLRVSTPASEAAAVLRMISGKDFGDDPEKWQEWWKKARGSFKVVVRLRCSSRI